MLQTDALALHFIYSSWNCVQLSCGLQSDLMYLSLSKKGGLELLFCFTFFFYEAVNISLFEYDGKGLYCQTCWNRKDTLSSNITVQEDLTWNLRGGATLLKSSSIILVIRILFFYVIGDKIHLKTCYFGFDAASNLQNNQ